jgi:hypothetical protein
MSNGFSGVSVYPEKKVVKDIAMKKLSAVLSVIAIIFTLAVLPQFITSALGAIFQQPETAWVVWETGSPVQRLARDANSTWSGMYQGGLGQWQLPAGQIKSLGTADGLSGDHVLSVAVDAGGRKWSAALDGGVNRLDGNTLADLTPGGAAGQNPWDLYADGDQLWLGSLGGGVSHYADGAWTTYDTGNSALPNDDIYAVAVDNSGQAWAGTVGYGIAALENGAWVPYIAPIPWAAISSSVSTSTPREIPGSAHWAAESTVSPQTARSGRATVRPTPTCPKTTSSTWPWMSRAACGWRPTMPAWPITGPCLPRLPFSISTCSTSPLTTPVK